MHRNHHVVPEAVKIAMAVAVASSCSEPRDSTRNEVTPSDSAGVEVVTNMYPAADDSVVDLTNADATWTFGSGGESIVPLSGVRGVIPIGDTLVAVANGQQAEILVVHRSGEIVERFGRIGEGPGEYGFMWYPWLAPPDTIVVYDPSLRRVTLTHVSGQVARIDLLISAATQAPADVGTALVSGRFSDGSYLITPNQLLPAERGTPGVSFRTITRYNPITETLHTIARLPYAETNMGTRGNAELFTFAPLAMNIASGDKLVTGLPTSFQFEVRTLSGDLLRTVRRSWTNIEVSERHIAAHHAASPQHPGESDQARRERLAGIQYRDSFPAYERYGFVARDGDVWIPHYPLPEGISNRWSVFDSTGIWVRDVIVPRGVRVRAVAGDEVFTIRTDTLGVESVVVYSLK
jgi:hypothetical protein